MFHLNTTWSIANFILCIKVLVFRLKCYLQPYIQTTAVTDINITVSLIYSHSNVMVIMSNAFHVVSAVQYF